MSQRLTPLIHVLIWPQLDIERDFDNGGIIKAIGLPEDLQPATVVEWVKARVMPWVQGFRRDHGELSDFVTIAMRVEDGITVGGPVLMPLPLFFDKHDYANLLRSFSESHGIECMVNICEAKAAAYKAGSSHGEGDQLSFNADQLPPSQRPDAVDILHIAVDFPFGFRGALSSIINADGSYGEPAWFDNTTNPLAGRGRMMGLSGGTDPDTVGQA